jgi:hypothetical protein
MTTLNNQPTGLFKRSRNDYEIFDALPREVKELIWNAPISFTTGQRQITSINQLNMVEINAKLREATIRAWGPDHPQVTKPRTMLSAEQLGF